MTRQSAYTKKWREDFKERDPEGYAEYRRLEHQKRYQKNREKIIAQTIEWAKNHPAEIKVIKKRCQDKKGFLGRQNEILIQKYGINLDQRNDMLANQGNVCAICGDDDPPTCKNGQLGWAVDHCHAYEEQTGGIKVRGILCIRCNSLLGMARDDISILLNAVAYLTKHK